MSGIGSSLKVKRAGARKAVRQLFLKRAFWGALEYHFSVVNDLVVRKKCVDAGSTRIGVS